MSKFRVCNKKCDECLFTTNKIVSDKRKREVIQGCLQEDTFFVCHKATIKGESVCCKGFYETYGSQINIVRIAQRLNAVSESFNYIEVVDVDELSK